MNKKQYTAIETIEETGISQSTLSRSVNGYKIWNKSKTKYWEVPAMLTENVDYIRTMEKGRAKIYYFDSAIHILKREKDIKTTIADDAGPQQLQDKIIAETDELKGENTCKQR